MDMYNITNKTTRFSILAAGLASGLLLLSLLVKPYPLTRKKPAASAASPLSITLIQTSLDAIDYPLSDGKYNFHHGRTTVIDAMTIRIMAWGQGDSVSISECVIAVDQRQTALSTITLDIDGSVMDSWVTDLDSDGNFEVLVWSQSAGSGSYGEMNIYEWNGDNLQAMPLPQLTQAQNADYMGHDEFSVDGDTLIRQFPLYHKDDCNADATNGKRIIRFQLRDNQWDVEAHDLFIESIKGQIRRIKKKVQ